MQGHLAKKLLLHKVLRNEGAPSYTTAQAEEYIKEAEHQDGIQFWWQFRSFAEVWEDFQRYWLTHIKSRRKTLLVPSLQNLSKGSGTITGRTTSTHSNIDEILRTHPRRKDND